MNSNIFIRNIKLYELGIGELSDIENKLYNFSNNYLKNINIYTSDKYPDFYLIGENENNIILKYEILPNTLYISDINLWRYLQLEFDNISYYDIREMVGLFIGAILDLEISITFSYNHETFENVKMNRLER